MVTVGVAANEQVLPASIGWATCGGAIGEAMDRLTAEKLIDEYEFRFIVNYSECSPSAAVGVGVTFMKDVRVDMVLGPPCTEGLSNCYMCRCSKKQQFDPLGIARFPPSHR
ncbi:unnamed protein product [Nippostrongylus brasiliensis]|uniref:ANF_receptor domain-containing protein n=1 Tax=Nippostrongylus brasiliensis TaxID=27835 RepID=A0A0N4YYE3_NIPBR|nr:unnamed protein product [Nippostrongylus brasiliensis]